MKIDYPSLSLQDALDIAILIEEEAEERYTDLADQLEQHRTPEAAKFFRVMVFAESKHAEKLRERRQAAFGDAPSKVDSTIVPEIEAPAFDSVRAFITEHAALRVALASETRAEEFYAKALEQVTDKDVRELFSEMRAEEVEHQGLVQERLDKLPPEDTRDPDDYVDPPVAQ